MYTECYGAESNKEEKVRGKRMKKKIVVDVDAGTDDAVALLLLLALESKRNYNVVGITCTHGNTTVDDVCRNVLVTLHFINRLDVPVFRGAEGPLIAAETLDQGEIYFHGKNGFGDKVFSTPEKDTHSENAVAALNRLALENDGIVLLCLGPLTNIALALRTYPTFSEHLQEVYIMGGNIKGVGNSTSSGEFNFHKDPEAAHIVLSSLTCPTTILPWETSLKCHISKKERFDDIGSLPHPLVRFLNEIETDVYRNEEFWSPCDGLLAGVFLDKNMIKRCFHSHMTVELGGLYTRGQGVIDHLRKRRTNVIIVDETDDEVFKQLVLEMASFVPK